MLSLIAWFSFSGLFDFGTGKKKDVSINILKLSRHIQLVIKYQFVMHVIIINTDL